MQNFSHLLQRLTDAGVDFVIVGGYAAVAHGSSLVTRDLDICAVLTPDNVERLRQTLADAHPRHRMTPQRLSFLEYPGAGQPVQNLYLETDIGVIDVLSSILGVGDFARLWSKAEKLEVAGRTYRVISLEDLIKAKEALGHERDVLAVKELRAIAAKRQQGGAAH
jgi:predicted nucleotidyltransferase